VLHLLAGAMLRWYYEKTNSIRVKNGTDTQDDEIPTDEPETIEIPICNRYEKSAVYLSKGKPLITAQGRKGKIRLTERPKFERSPKRNVKYRHSSNHLRIVSLERKIREIWDKCWVYCWVLRIWQIIKGFKKSFNLFNFLVNNQKFLTETTPASSTGLLSI
jgi:hypothetical protein